MSARFRILDSSWMLDENKRSRPASLDEAPDSVYLEKLENIFSASTMLGVPPQPTMITDHVYLGTQFQGENIALLKRMRFKNVLNCAGIPEGDSPRRVRASRYKGTDIEYEEIPLDDKEYAEITPYFGQATACIEAARARGRNILIYCTGVSRSGAIALAYLLKSGQTLLKAAQALKEDRRLVCCNSGFNRQIVAYARMLGRLDPEPGMCWAPRYMRKLDCVRIRNSYVPDYLRLPYKDVSYQDPTEEIDVGYVRHISTPY